MFDNMLSSSNVLTGLETALRIEMDSSAKTKALVDAAIERIENTYSVTIDNDVFTLMEMSQLQSDQLSIFIRDLQLALSRLSFFTDLKMYHKNIPITLADVNYLGYAREQLLTALRYLQDDNESHKHADDIVTPLYNALDNISMCSAKRLFVILLVLHRLGIEEGVSAVARMLYLGGLVV